MWVLRFILHDWNDGDAARILAALRAAMGTTPVTLCICEARPPSHGMRRSMGCTPAWYLPSNWQRTCVDACPLLSQYQTLCITCAALDACMLPGSARQLAGSAVPAPVDWSCDGLCCC